MTRLETLFRHQLDHMLELALRLLNQGRVTAAQVEGLRIAIARYRREAIELREAWAAMPPDLLAIGERLVALLTDADRQLTEDQVRPIEKRIELRLHVASGVP
jgi:hypothetical protein